MDKYYKKAAAQIKNNEVEEALTTFITGLDRGFTKCAYGLLHTVMHCCAYTMTEEEAISIFCSSYAKIKLLAQEGDTEAMVMVAEGVRHGFVEDDGEPYLFWLAKAAALGNKSAAAIMEELEQPDDLLALPAATQVAIDAALEEADATDLMLLDAAFDLTVVGNREEVTETLEEFVLVDEPDWVMREQYGINDYLKDCKRQYELLKGRDDSVV